MAIDDNTSYELTGYQVKDLAQKIRAKADSNSLASVATSGLYSDLTGAPTIPTVYNGTLTIQQNGTTLGTFSANQSTNETINITGGGSTYTAGNGISIDSNNEISIDTSVVAEVSDIPTVNDAVLTITQNGTSAGTFTANASSNVTVALTDTTYTDMIGASSSIAGASGLVPAPAAGDEDKVLSGAGTWVSQPTVPTDYVTLTTNQNITGEKTFVGDKRIKFKGSAANSKLGFTAYNSSDAEIGFLECKDDSGIKNNYLGIWNSTSNNQHNRLGFQYHNRYGADIYSYNIICPPKLNKGGSYLNDYFYLPIKYTDGVTTVTASDEGVVDLSTLIPSVPTVNDGTLTIQHNGTNVQTFTANQSTSATANIQTIYSVDAIDTTAVTPTVTADMIDWTTLNVLIDTAPTASTFFGGSYTHTFTAPVAGYYEINTPFSCLCHRTANALNTLTLSMDSTSFAIYTYASESGDTEWGMSRRTITATSPVTVHLSAGTHTLTTSGDLYYDSAMSSNSFIGTITAKLVQAD